MDETASLDIYLIKLDDLIDQAVEHTLLEQKTYHRALKQVRDDRYIHQSDLKDAFFSEAANKISEIALNQKVQF